MARSVTISTPIPTLEEFGKSLGLSKRRQALLLRLSGATTAKDGDAGRKKVYRRSAIVLPEMVGHAIRIKDARGSLPRIQVTEAMIGHKLEEFTPARQHVRVVSKTKEKN